MIVIFDIQIECSCSTPPVAREQELAKAWQINDDYSLSEYKVRVKYTHDFCRTLPVNHDYKNSFNEMSK